MTKRAESPGDKWQGGYLGAICEETLLLICCGFCFVVGATAAFGSKVIGEWADLGSAVGGANQGYVLTGVAVGHPNAATHPTDTAVWSGSAFVDQQDFCDQSATCGVRFCQPPAPESP